jgi:DNA-binding NarL/FixJ family response regulator
VILLADSEVDDSFLVASVEAGASGILDGKAGVEEVVGAVRAAAAGHHIVDVDRFITAVEATARAREVKRDREARTDQLTDRERDVLTCLARAMSNADIADRLSISPRTVDKHVQHILQKLGVKSRLAAAILASRMGDLANEEMRGTA